MHLCKSVIVLGAGVAGLTAAHVPKRLSNDVL